MFKGCGQPRLGKRSATTSEINFESVKFDRAGSGGGTGTGGANVRPTTAAGTSLDRLVRDIKQKVCFKAVSSLSLSCFQQNISRHSASYFSPTIFRLCVKWGGGLRVTSDNFLLFWRHLW